MNLCICELWNSTNQLQSNITLEHIEISMLSHKIVENWNSFKIIVISRWLNGNKTAEWKTVQIFLYDTVFMYWRNIEKYTNFCMLCTFNVVQTHQESNNRRVDGSFGFGPFPWFHPQLTIDLTLSSIFCGNPCLTEPRVFEVSLQSCAFCSRTVEALCLYVDDLVVEGRNIREAVEDK